MTKDEIAMFNENEKLIHYVIRKYRNNGIPYEDLYSIGKLAMIEGILKFDKTKNFQPATFLIPCIQNGINMFVRKDKKTCKISIESMNDSLANGFEVVDDTNIEREVEEQEILNQCLKYIDTLPIIDKAIISYTYGINGNPKHTQMEIACATGLSQGSISRKIQHIIHDMKGALKL